VRYPHLATRLFGVPLLISRPKLDAILAALGPRMGFQVERASDAEPEPKAYGPGDKGRERKSYYVTEDGIGIIEAIGPLVKRNSGEFISGGPTTYGEIESEFTDAITDPNIKGVLLLVDSPGGEAAGAMELSDLIYSQRGSKPIFAAADGDAFSAAYALASAADRLFVAKSGGVGSVGVWMLHVDWSKAEEKAGINPTYIFAGARKIDGNPDMPLSDEARKTFQDLVDGAYQMFTETVARNRGISVEAVRKTEAGMFFGQPKRGNKSAVDIGFADAVGTVADAMAALRSRIDQQSSVAKLSATNSPKGKGTTNMDESKVADTQKPPEPEAKPPEGDTAGLADQTAKARGEGFAAGFAHAKALIEWCGVAGLPIKKALAFLKPEASTDAIRKELLEAGAAESGPEIHGHVLPEAGAMPEKITAANVDKSPLVKLAEERAAARGGK
jgi:signal peptide peptidase SppA